MNLKSFWHLCLAFCFSPSLFGTPQGFQLKGGEAAAPVIDPNGSMTIQSGSRAVIHWDQFSIDKGQIVRFTQKDMHSAVLNRVVGLSESQIHGLLQSNGKVFLINPNGICIGPSGRIETAGFIASTLDLLNEDFFKDGSLTFRGLSDRSIINLGTIQSSSGDVFLVGARVKNLGTIQAPQGVVGLGCGQEILIQPRGKERIFIKAATEIDSEVPLEHSGIIESLAAEMRSGANPYAKAIRVTGTIDTFSTHEEGGRVYLVAEEGRLDFSGTVTAKQGTKGGEVNLLGTEVFLTDSGRVDISGDEGGGNAQIGGSFQGKDPFVKNAKHTYIGKDVVIDANAHLTGDGGRVVVWADEGTAFFGAIDAKGGLNGGDGGFVEVSGKYLDFQGIVNRTAPKGKPGTLYLDPIDVTISNSPDSNVNNPGGAGEYTFPPGCGAANINATNLGANLELGNVTIDTSASGAASCSAVGNISVTGGVSWNNPNTLTLIADGGITITNGQGVDPATGPVTLQTRKGDLTINSGFIECSGNGLISLNINGNLVISGSQGYFNGIQPYGSLTGTITGDVTINGSSGTLNPGSGIGISLLNSPKTTNVNLTIGGNLILQSTISDGMAFIGSGQTTSSAYGMTYVTLNVGGNVTLNATQGITRIGNYHVVTSQTGDINLTAGGSISCTVGATGSMSYIGHQSSSAFTGSNNITVIAGNNITLDSTGSSGQAYIQNLATTTGSNNITLVCDNANSTRYNSSSTAGILVTGSNSFIRGISPGTKNPVKLYTVQSSLNTFPSTINYAAYPPLASQASLYEQSAVLYPGGTYGGQEYMIFYKQGYGQTTPAPAPSPSALVYNNQVTSTAIITSILSPATTDSSSTMTQGPAAQTDTNPLSEDNQKVPLNNDGRSQYCP